MSETVINLIKLQKLDTKVAEGKIEPNAYRRKRRRELVEIIPVFAARTYDRIRTRHVDAIVPVLDGICQGCYVHLPSAVMVQFQFQHPRDQVCCDHCGRILYLSK